MLRLLQLSCCLACLALTATSGQAASLAPAVKTLYAQPLFVKPLFVKPLFSPPSKAARTEIQRLEEQIRESQKWLDQCLDELGKAPKSNDPWLRLSQLDDEEDVRQSLPRSRKIPTPIKPELLAPVKKRPPPAGLEALVTAVGKRDYVEISIGSDDGLRVGHRLEVHRNGVMIARGVVVKTAPNRSVLRIEKENKRAVVQPYDRATPIAPNVAQSKKVESKNN